MSFFRDAFFNTVYVCGGVAALLNIWLFNGSVEYTIIAILLVIIFRIGYVLGEYSGEAGKKDNE